MTLQGPVAIAAISIKLLLLLGERKSDAVPGGLIISRCSWRPNSSEVCDGFDIVCYGITIRYSRCFFALLYEFRSPPGSGVCYCYVSSGSPLMSYMRIVRIYLYFEV